MNLVITVLRIGPKLITALALDSMLSSPKVKVKVVFLEPRQCRPSCIVYVG